MRGRFPAVAAMACFVMGAAGVPARSMTCTHELTQEQFAGSRPFETTCGTVAVSLLPIVSEMYYHRWSGEINVRSIGGGDEARVNLAAFDASGNLIGVMAVVPRDIGRKTKSLEFRMDAMYVSTVNTSKVIFSVSVPDAKEK